MKEDQSSIPQQNADFPYLMMKTSAQVSHSACKTAASASIFHQDILSRQSSSLCVRCTEYACVHIAADICEHPVRIRIRMEDDIMKVLHVVSYTLSSVQAIGDALNALRQLRMHSPHHAVLLFCDLPDAPCQKLPDEQPLMNSLLHSICVMNSSQEPKFFLLVRSRVWDDAARMYLGSSQMLSRRTIMAQLLVHGQTQAKFEASSVSPASLKGGFDAVLFSDMFLPCTPDVPSRMADDLEKASLSAVGARVLPHHEHPCSALSLICARCPFSLSPIQAMREYCLGQQGRVSCDQPVMYTAEALLHLDDIHSVPVAPSCAFQCSHAPTVQSIFLSYRKLCRKQPFPHACMPPLQFAFLAAAAVFGIPLLALFAALPELWALFHPHAWSGALLRTALLPLTTLHALDWLLCHLLAHSPLLRLRVPVRLFSPLVCLFAALALLIAALISVDALVSVLPFVFSWLCMPVLYPVLDQPDDGGCRPRPAPMTSGISSPNP